MRTPGVKAIQASFLSDASDSLCEILSTLSIILFYVIMPGIISAMS